MAWPRKRILVPVLLAALALAGWQARGLLFPGQLVQMRDNPCPAPASKADEAVPVKYDWVDLCRYVHDNARVLARGAPVEAVFFGDSILAYWQEEPSAPFTPARLNRAMAGQTSQQLLLRMRQDVIALKPRVVVIEGGINDVLGNTGLIGPKGYFDDVESMIDLTQAHGIAVVLVSLPPAGRHEKRPDVDFPPRVAQLNRGLAELAARRGAVFADIYTPLAGPGGLPRADWTTDGIHLTQGAYGAIRPVIDRAVEQALQAAPESGAESR